MERGRMDGRAGAGLAQDVPNAVFLGYEERERRRAAERRDVRPAGDLPRVAVHRDVVALPGAAGLYTLAGERVRGTEPLYVAEDVPVTARDAEKFARSNALTGPPTLDLEDAFRRLGDPEIVAEPTLHLGAFNAHYGHFLTDHTSRLWALATAPEGIRADFRPKLPDASFREAPHVRLFLEAFGLGGAASDILDRPRLLREALVPEPAFQARYRIYRNAADPHLRVAEQLPAAPPPPARPVYLSRSRLVDGKRAVTNEEAVERLFAERGFAIVHPQTLSLAGQIALFNTAPVIAAFSGSALHTGMFCRPDYAGTMLVLTGDEPINGRLLLSGAIKGYRTIYMKSYGYTPKRDGAPGVMTPDLDRIRDHLATVGL
jgi:hypothetical protein